MDPCELLRQAMHCLDGAYDLPSIWEDERIDDRLRGGPDHEDNGGSLFEWRIIGCATKVPHWLDMGMIMNI